MPRYRKKSKQQRELYGLDKRKDPTLELFEMMKAYVPKAMVAKLKSLAEDRGVPLGRIISWGLYNEFKRDGGFEIDIRLPTTVTEDVIEKSEKVMAFIEKTRAVSIDMLVLCKEEIGLSQRDILASVRFLLSSSRIEHYERGMYPGLIQVRPVSPERAQVLAEVMSEPKYRLKV